MSGMYLALALCASLWSMRLVGFVATFIKNGKAMPARRRATRELEPATA